MRNRRLIIGFCLLVIFGALSALLLQQPPQSAEHHHEVEEGNEERPDQPRMKPEEKKLFLSYLEQRHDAQDGNARKLDDHTSTYANGDISGTWSYKIPQTGWNGYRVDNSTYDSLRNIFYIISYAGHIYRLETEPEIKWTLLNHKVVINPPSNIAANPIFTGVYLPDNTYRLIRSNEDQNRMEYSDDEGRTWIPATGANISMTTASKALQIKENGQTRIALQAFYGGTHYFYFSDDHGATYQRSQLTVSSSNADARLDKPYNTNELYLWVWSKSNNRVKKYTYNPEQGDYEYISESTSTLPGNILSNAMSTYHAGKYHFYLSSINSGNTYNFYHTNDGITWTQTNSNHDRPIETLVPGKPGILFTGFEDVQMTTNQGRSWTGFGHNMGWDLQHMSTYAKAGGGHITVLGLDFGCYISETPEDKESYNWCNNGAQYAMHYDAASNELYNSIYMGNQDRGATAYRDTGDTVSTIDVDGTDVLRVAYSNNGRSVWSWFYYGTIRHRHNFALSNSQTTTYTGLGNWWAAPMIPSPVAGENAIYGAFGSNLQIFRYNESSNSISRSSHPFDFNSAYGSDIGSFGYSEINKDKWYVALNNGRFIISEDGGNTWRRNFLGQGPRSNDQGYNYVKNQAVIKGSKLDEETIYWSGVGNMFMVSTDGGTTFQNKNNGLNVYRFRDFALSPDEKFVFAACGYGGAWVYSFSDDMWYQMNDDPIPSVDFTDVEFIEGKNLVRYATYGSGILEFKLDNSFSIVNAPAELQATIPMKNHIALSWSDLSENEGGFLIERSTGGEFTQIGTVSDNAVGFIDSTASFGEKYFYRVRSYVGDFKSSHSNIINIDVPQEGIMSKSAWYIVDVSSEETSGEYAPAEYAIDNNVNTYWHTQWRGGEPAHPHEMIFSTGQPVVISGFGYQPRQDWTDAGTIADYEFYVSMDGENWGTPVKSGTFASDITYKEVSMILPATGKYVKLVAKSAINNENFASAAEIDIFYYNQIPQSPSNLRAQVQGPEARLSWDVSDFESGYTIEQLINGDFVQIATVDPGITNYDVKNLELGIDYEYRVKAFNYAGVSSASNILTLKAQPLFAKVGQPRIKMYPNPATDLINLQLPEKTERGLVKLIDLQGKTLKSAEINNTDFIKISVTDLPRGIYSLQVITGVETFEQRLVIQ